MLIFQSLLYYSSSRIILPLYWELGFIIILIGGEPIESQNKFIGAQKRFLFATGKLETMLFKVRDTAYDLNQHKSENMRYVGTQTPARLQAAGFTST